MRIASKRGISPVIATILLIALSLVLAAIIFLWAKGFVTEQVEKGGEPTENVCGKVLFDAEVIKGRQTILLTVINRGNVPINGFDIKGISGGDSSIKTFDFPVDVGGTVPAKQLALFGDPEEIIIYPRVLGTVKGKQLNKAVTCLDNGKTIKL